MSDEAKPKTVIAVSVDEPLDMALEKAKADIATELARAVYGQVDERIDEVTADGPLVPGRYRQLFAAAPALLRALVAVEWSGDVERPECPECRWSKRSGAHRDGCQLDAALTAAGLETQEQRDAARRST